MSSARADADNIVRSATDAARRKGEEIVNEASAEAARMKQRAEEEIDREKRQMLSDVRGEIADLSVSIASQVVGREIKAEDQQGFVDEFIKNVGEKQ